MSEVAVIFTPQELALWRAQQKLINQAQKLEDKYRKVGRAGQTAGRVAATGAKQSTAHNKLLNQQLLPLASSYLGVFQAVTQVNRAYQDQVEIAEKALTAQISLATAQSDAFKNLTGLPTPEALHAFDFAKSLGAEIGVDPAILTKAIGSAFSSDSTDITRVMDAVEQSARLNVLTPEAIPDIAGAALDVARGVRGATTAAENLGLILSAGKESRPVDPAEFTQQLAPAIAFGVQTVPEQDPREAAREAAVVFAQLTREATDKVGRRSLTGEIAFLVEMREFFKKLSPSEQRKKDEKEARELRELTPEERVEFLEIKERAIIPEDPGTIRGRIKAISATQELRDLFLGPKGFGERRSRGGIEAAVDPTSRIFNDFQRKFEAIDFSSDVFEEKVTQLTTGTPELEAAVFAKKSEVNLQLLSLTEELGRAGNEVKALRDTLRNTRPLVQDPITQGALEQVNKALAFVGIKSEQSILEERKNALRQDKLLSLLVGPLAASLIPAPREQDRSILPILAGPLGAAFVPEKATDVTPSAVESRKIETINAQLELLGAPKVGTEAIAPPAEPVALPALPPLPDVLPPPVQIVPAAQEPIEAPAEQLPYTLDDSNFQGSGQGQDNGFLPNANEQSRLQDNRDREAFVRATQELSRRRRDGAKHGLAAAEPPATTRSQAIAV